MISTMKKHSQVSLLNLSCMFIFIIGCHGLDPSYETCVPKDCGDGRNISYPYYIYGSQDSSCGYPGFELRCDVKGSPVLEISGNSYLVKEINYTDQVMRLTINTSQIPCRRAVKNITLDSERFVLDSRSNTVFAILKNCSKQLSKDLTSYRINGSCDVDALVMLKDDVNFINGTQSCSNVVMMPVQHLNELVDGGNYAETVERGFVVRWIVADYCRSYESSGGRCGFNITAYQFRCFCTDRPHMVACRPGKDEKVKRLMVIALISIGGASTILVAIILWLVKKIKQKRKTKNHLIVEFFLKNHEFLAPKRYSYSQVKKMTNSFKLRLGQDGFGTVYKGTLNNGNLVAVKVLSKLKSNGEDFINEVASVGRTSHVNIVSLVGYCCDGHKKALIYEFMPNGSLDKFIYSREISTNSQLGWEKLHQIFVGVARGLEYLHSGCNTRILHFDIKPHNILLDETLCPKILDFGLAKLSLENKSFISMSHMRGTC